MLRFLKNGDTYHVINRVNETVYTISAPSKETRQGCIRRGNRKRYLFSFDRPISDTNAIDRMLHHAGNGTCLPYRLTDELGKERGWLPAAPSKDITGRISFFLNGRSYGVTFFRTQEHGPISEFSVYAGADSDTGPLIAKASGLDSPDTSNARVASVNDIAAEVAIAIISYFIFGGVNDGSDQV